VYYRPSERRKREHAGETVDSALYFLSSISWRGEHHLLTNFLKISYSFFTRSANICFLGRLLFFDLFFSIEMRASSRFTLTVVNFIFF